MTNLPTRQQDLPMSLLGMAETLDDFHGAGVGMRIAIKLMQHFGGRDLKFPVRPKPGHPVVAALGVDDAALVCQLLHGQQIYIPHNRGRQSYREAVRTMQSEGKTRAQIGAFLGLSDRHVRRVAGKPDPAPLPLFPDLED